MPCNNMNCVSRNIIEIGLNGSMGVTRSCMKTHGEKGTPGDMEFYAHPVSSGISFADQRFPTKIEEERTHCDCPLYTNCKSPGIPDGFYSTSGFLKMYHYHSALHLFTKLGSFTVSPSYTGGGATIYRQDIKFTIIGFDVVDKLLYLVYSRWGIVRKTRAFRIMVGCL